MAQIAVPSSNKSQQRVDVIPCSVMSVRTPWYIQHGGRQRRSNHYRRTVDQTVLALPTGGAIRESVPIVLLLAFVHTYTLYEHTPAFPFNAQKIEHEALSALPDSERIRCKVALRSNRSTQKLKPDASTAPSLFRFTSEPISRLLIEIAVAPLSSVPSELLAFKVIRFCMGFGLENSSDRAKPLTSIPISHHCFSPPPPFCCCIDGGASPISTSFTSPANGPYIPASGSLLPARSSHCSAPTSVTRNASLT